jgi:2-C-methyl-D-erythritol 4-phosphate cytidylyltransferase
MKNIAIIFAGGSGSRMGHKTSEGEDLPKQFIEVEGKPIIIWTLEYFENSQQIDEIVIVMNPEWIEYCKDQITKFGMQKISAVVEGGETSQDSIYNGLVKAKELFGENNIVLLHDGVRPLISEKLIDDCIDSVKKHGTAITSLPATETIVYSKSGVLVNDTSVRNETYIASAPQAFILNEILDAHNEIRHSNPEYINIVDSCTLYNNLGKQCHLVRGPIGNIKLTRPEDIATFKAIKAYRENN